MTLIESIRYLKDNYQLVLQILKNKNKAKNQIVFTFNKKTDIIDDKPFFAIKKNYENLIVYKNDKNVLIDMRNYTAFYLVKKLVSFYETIIRDSGENLYNMNNQFEKLREQFENIKNINKYEECITLSVNLKNKDLVTLTLDFKTNSICILYKAHIVYEFDTKKVLYNPDTLIPSKTFEEIISIIQDTMKFLEMQVTK